MKLLFLLSFTFILGIGSGYSIFQRRSRFWTDYTPKIYGPPFPFGSGSRSNSPDDSSSEEDSAKMAGDGDQQSGWFTGGQQYGDTNREGYGRSPILYSRRIGGGYGGGYRGYNGGGGGGGWGGGGHSTDIFGGGGGGGVGGYLGQFDRGYGSGNVGRFGSQSRSGRHSYRRKQPSNGNAEFSRLSTSCLGNQDCRTATDGMTTKHPGFLPSRLDTAFDKDEGQKSVDQLQLAQHADSSYAQHLTESGELLPDD